LLSYVVTLVGCYVVVVTVRLLFGLICYVCYGCCYGLRYVYVVYFTLRYVACVALFVVVYGWLRFVNVPGCYGYGLPLLHIGLG